MITRQKKKTYKIRFLKLLKQKNLLTCNNKNFNLNNLHGNLNYNFLRLYYKTILLSRISINDKKEKKPYVKILQI